MDALAPVISIPHPPAPHSLSPFSKEVSQSHILFLTPFLSSELFPSNWSSQVSILKSIYFLSLYSENAYFFSSADTQSLFFKLINSQYKYIQRYTCRPLACLSHYPDLHHSLFLHEIVSRCILSALTSTSLKDVHSGLNALTSLSHLVHYQRYFRNSNFVKFLLKIPESCHHPLIKNAVLKLMSQFSAHPIGFQFCNSDSLTFLLSFQHSQSKDMLASLAKTLCNLTRFTAHQALFKSPDLYSLIEALSCSPHAQIQTPAHIALFHLAPPIDPDIFIASSDLHFITYCASFVKDPAVYQALSSTLSQTGLYPEYLESFSIPAIHTAILLLSRSQDPLTSSHAILAIARFLGFPGSNFFLSPETQDMLAAAAKSTDLMTQRSVGAVLYQSFFLENMNSLWDEAPLKSILGDLGTSEDPILYFFLFPFKEKKDTKFRLTLEDVASAYRFLSGTPQIAFNPISDFFLTLEQTTSTQAPRILSNLLNIFFSLPDSSPFFTKDLQDLCFRLGQSTHVETLRNLSATIANLFSPLSTPLIAFPPTELQALLLHLKSINDTSIDTHISTILVHTTQCPEHATLWATSKGIPFITSFSRHSDPIILSHATKSLFNLVQQAKSPHLFRIPSVHFFLTTVAQPNSPPSILSHVSKILFRLTGQFSDRKAFFSSPPTPFFSLELLMLSFRLTQHAVPKTHEALSHLLLHFFQQKPHHDFFNSPQFRTLFFKLMDSPNTTAAYYVSVLLDSLSQSPHLMAAIDKSILNEKMFSLINRIDPSLQAFLKSAFKRIFKLDTQNARNHRLIGAPPPEDPDSES